MVGSSVFPDSRVLRMVSPSVFLDSQGLRMVGSSVFPDSRVLRMVGPSVFPDSRVENPVLRFQNIHFLESVAKSDPPDPPIRSVSSSQYRRIPRGLKLIANFGQKSIFL